MWITRPLRQIHKSLFYLLLKTVLFQETWCYEYSTEGYVVNNLSSLYKKDESAILPGPNGLLLLLVFSFLEYFVSITHTETTSSGSKRYQGMLHNSSLCLVDLIPTLFPLILLDYHIVHLQNWSQPYLSAKWSVWLFLVSREIWG